MKREIKFRAWDIEKSKMMYPQNGYFVRESGTRFQISADGKCTSVYIEESIIKNPVLMQYTGRKDKNGTEVYEGDIVKWGGHLYEIIWDKEYAQFNHKAITCDTDDYFECGNSEAQEVIGNIHENPELLEQEVV